jgi:chitin disaccharide deacetylase
VGRLIVNADDFGLTGGVNRAVVELNRAGLLTSATLMANAAATGEAIEIACRTPSLAVGCHVVLVDGGPVLRAAQLPTLADARTGRFRPSLGSLLRGLTAGRIRPAEIEAEAAAQIALLRDRGLRLSHIDTHKHAHMFPAVLRPVLRAPRAAGLCRVRNPFEPPWSVRATTRATSRAFGMRRVQVGLLRQLEPAFRRIVAKEGFVTTEGCIGVMATGALDSTTVSALLRELRPGDWELVTHPGYNDGDLDRIWTRLRSSRELELDALRMLADFPAVERISFADLPVP